MLKKKPRRAPLLQDPPVGGHGEISDAALQIQLFAILASKDRNDELRDRLKDTLPVAGDNVEIWDDAEFFLDMGLILLDYPINADALDQHNLAYDWWQTYKQTDNETHLILAQGYFDQSWMFIDEAKDCHDDAEANIEMLESTPVFISIQDPGGQDPPVDQFASLQAIRDLESAIATAKDLRQYALEQHNEAVTEWNRVQGLVNQIPVLNPWWSYCQEKLNNATPKLNEALAWLNNGIQTNGVLDPGAAKHLTDAEGHLSNAKFKHNQGLWAAAIAECEAGHQDLTLLAEDIAKALNLIDEALELIADAEAGYEIWMMQ